MSEFHLKLSEPTDQVNVCQTRKTRKLEMGQEIPNEHERFWTFRTRVQQLTQLVNAHLENLVLEWKSKDKETRQQLNSWCGGAIVGGRGSGSGMSSSSRRNKSLHLSTVMKQTLRGPLQTADALNGLYYLKICLRSFLSRIDNALWKTPRAVSNFEFRT